jgi:hypothetical protein
LIAFDGLLWLLLMLGPFILFQRILHRELQVVFLLLTRRAELAVALFSLLLFPGVLLHEISHFLTAKLLRVPTGHFSLIPQSTVEGRLRLGYVETSQTDILRDALIGAAPLIAGGLFVGYTGLVRLDLLSLWNALAKSGLSAGLESLAVVYAQTDFWLWFYLMVVISSTMMPSAADRRAWLPLALVIAFLVGLALFFGMGPWMSANLAPTLNNVLQTIAVVFAISSGVHLVVLLPTFIIRKLLNRLTGLRVV